MQARQSARPYPLPAPPWGRRTTAATAAPQRSRRATAGAASETSTLRVVRYSCQKILSSRAFCSSYLNAQLDLKRDPRADLSFAFRQILRRLAEQDRLAGANIGKAVGT